MKYVLFFGITLTLSISQCTFKVDFRDINVLEQVFEKGIASAQCFFNGHPTQYLEYFTTLANHYNKLHNHLFHIAYTGYNSKTHSVYFQAIDISLIKKQVAELKRLSTRYAEYLSEIDYNQYPAITRRYEARKKAIDCLENGTHFFTKKYLLSEATKKTLQDYNLPEQVYQTNTGNIIQHHIHEELLQIFAQITKLKHQCFPIYGKKNTQNNTSFDSLATIAQFADVAHKCNQKGAILQGLSVADFCWSMLEYSYAIAKGFNEGCMRGIQTTTQILYKVITSPGPFFQEIFETGSKAAINLVRIAVECDNQACHVKRTGDVSLSQYVPLCPEYADYDPLMSCLLFVKQNLEDASKEPKQFVKSTVSTATELAVSTLILDGIFKAFGQCIIPETIATTKNITKNISLQKPNWWPQANSIAKLFSRGENERLAAALAMAQKIRFFLVM